MTRFSATPNNDAESLCLLNERILFVSIRWSCFSVASVWHRAGHALASRNRPLPHRWTVKNFANSTSNVLDHRSTIIRSARRGPSFVHASLKGRQQDIVGIVQVMSVPLPLRFLRSASAHNQLPESVNEIAIVGRSNVGKSSLINAIANRNKLAKTSKTPGATQLLNIYEFGDEDSGRWLVDLPGYGFAKLSKNRQRAMATMINDYVLEREPLTHAVVLIDANVGPTALDLQTIDWLREIDLAFVVVGTKVDKIKSGDRSKKQKKAAEKLQMTSGDIRWVSAEKGTGIPELRSVLANLLNG